MKRCFDGDPEGYHEIADNGRYLDPYDGEKRARDRRRENDRLILPQLPKAGTRGGQVHLGWRAAQWAHWRAQELGWPLHRQPQPYQVEFANADEKRRLPKAVRFYADEVVAGVGRTLICEIQIPHWDHVPTMTEEHTDAAAGPA